MEHHNHDEKPLTHSHGSEELDLLSQAFETKIKSSESSVTEIVLMPVMNI
jgi:hypothetical protein